MCSQHNNLNPTRLWPFKSLVYVSYWIVTYYIPFFWGQRTIYNLNTRILNVLPHSWKDKNKNKTKQNKNLKLGSSAINHEQELPHMLPCIELIQARDGINIILINIHINSPHDLQYKSCRNVLLKYLRTLAIVNYLNPCINT